MFGSRHAPTHAIVLALAASLGPACGAEGGSDAPTERAAGERQAASGDESDQAPTSADEGAETDASRWEARRGDAVVTITDGPGVLVDSNAPPPVPGEAPATHPAVGASCQGDAASCGEAGRVVRAAATRDAVLDGLARAGFEIRPVD